MTINECYAVLEIAPGASLEEAKKSYKLLATVWHPDRFPPDSKRFREAEDRLRRFNQAWEMLREHLAADGRSANTAESNAEPAGQPDSKQSQKSRTHGTRNPSEASSDLVPRLLIPRWAMIVAGVVLGSVLGVCTAYFVVGVSTVVAGVIGAIVGAAVGCFTNRSSKTLQTET